jgi:hypothetical protein
MLDFTQYSGILLRIYCTEEDNLDFDSEGGRFAPAVLSEVFCIFLSPLRRMLLITRYME